MRSGCCWDVIGVCVGCRWDVMGLGLDLGVLSNPLILMIFIIV